MPIGGTPDFSTVYFTYPGTLLREDSSRAPHAHPRATSKEDPEVEAWGFYEDSEGVLRDVGVLPDGSLDPFGAVPAATGHGKLGVAFEPPDNQVSADGSRVFFVSPDPNSCEQNGGVNDCKLDPPELYVRENGQRTLLVSRDALSGGSAPADLEGSAESFAFASPDGSQAFFQSEDQLTSDAPEGPLANTSEKTYDFEVNTGTLTYLPNVEGKIVGSSEDGSSITFMRPAGGSSPAELDLWTAGPSGGSVTPITSLPGGENVEPVRMSSDGSVVVFMTSGLPGFNDVGAEEIFRYDARSNTLGCVSCAPTGIAPASASMSALQEQLGEPVEGRFEAPGMVDERGVSSDGDRVFFQTKAPLVPQDTNTNTFVAAVEHEGFESEGMDVYEWENGFVYLLSNGKSARNSYFLDNSESGNDVFFATTEALVPGVTDGGYSVYDARVPRSGDNPPPAAVPCQGSVCQGPPNVPSPLTPPASATFSGVGNPTPEPAAATPPPLKKATTKTVKCKRGYVKKKNKCVKNVRHERKKNRRSKK